MTGREREIAILKTKLASPRSEFIALYGRRRVGKTFLVRNVFEGMFTFQLTGMAQVKLQDQLTNFNDALQQQHPQPDRRKAESWMEALKQVRQIAEESKHTKKIIFIDELPWLGTKHSGFIPALEHFWNSWASARKDVLLIVCGSAASWMINTLINNKGGLHNRVTQQLKIEPFTLNECAKLLKNKKIALEHYQLVELYMVLGGIPFYWDALEKGDSAVQSINKLCFESQGLLRREFNNLFRSLFVKAERHEAVVNALAKKGRGLTREEISVESKLANGGGLTRLLDELEESGFIRRYMPFGKRTKNSLFQLSDFFSLFHIKWMTDQKKFDKDHWLKIAAGAKYRTWSGYAFEQVCFAHLPQIKKALGISGIATETSSWKSTQAKDGAQIDLVIDRKDGIVNICEMKFSVGPFVINKKYSSELRNKIVALKTETQTRKSIFLTIISTFGLANNAYSGNVQNDLKMDVLFEQA